MAILSAKEPFAVKLASSLTTMEVVSTAGICAFKSRFPEITCKLFRFNRAKDAPSPVATNTPSTEEAPVPLAPTTFPCPLMYIPPDSG